MQFVRKAYDTLFRVWELAVSVLGRPELPIFPRKAFLTIGRARISLPKCRMIRHNCQWVRGVPHRGALIHISITVPLFSELRRVGSVERGEKRTTKGRKIR
jgi:hypothetical protein